MSKKDINFCIVTAIMGLTGIFFYFVLGDKFSGSIIMTSTMVFIFSAIINILPKMSSKAEDKNADELSPTKEVQDGCQNEEVRGNQ